MGGGDGTSRWEDVMVLVYRWGTSVLVGGCDGTSVGCDGTSV